jgi:hypothetical protein
VDPEGLVPPPRPLTSVSQQFLSKTLRSLIRKRRSNNKIHSSPIAEQHVPIQSQNVQGLKDASRLETLLHVMKRDKLYAYCIQETWLEGECIQELKDGAVFIHHRPTKQRSSRSSCGICIVLSRRAVTYWKKGGEGQVSDLK